MGDDSLEQPGGNKKGVHNRGDWGKNGVKVIFVSGKSDVRINLNRKSTDVLDIFYTFTLSAHQCAADVQ
jgi:hypothetical protein